MSPRALPILFTLACSGDDPGTEDGFAVARIRVVAEGAPPTGTGSLDRRATSAQVDSDGTVLPAVSAGGLGSIAFGEIREIPLPQGLVVVDVRGFDPLAACGDAPDTGQDRCYPAPWTGMVGVLVTEGNPPAGLSVDHVMRPGQTIDVDIVVTPGCVCDD